MSFIGQHDVFFDVFEPVRNGLDHRQERGVDEQDGVAMILIALTRWYDKCEDMANLAIRSLVCITYYEDSSKQQLATIGISQILETANRYCESYSVRLHTVSLLGNLACTGEEMAMEVATDECIDIVMETMKKWPEDPYSQRSGVRYLQYIGEIEVIKERVKQLKVLSVLAHAADISRNGAEEDYKRACDTAKMYM